MTTLNMPMIDYATLTTWEHNVWQQTRFEWQGALTPVNEQRRMQYRGFTANNVFFGIAEQLGKPHYMVQASGEQADAFCSQATCYHMNCTRIDLQVTIEKPATFDARRLYDDLNRWDAPGRPRQVSMIQSGDGCDTVYIGNRQSDRFTRVYVKPTDSDGHVLRFETEYKGDHARTTFDYVLGGRGAIDSVLVAELKDLPDDLQGVFRLFSAACGADAHRPKIKRVTGQNATLDWLRKQVEPTVARLCNDHDCGQEARKLVSSWHERYC